MAKSSLTLCYNCYLKMHLCEIPWNDATHKLDVLQTMPSITYGMYASLISKFSQTKKKGYVVQMHYVLFVEKKMDEGYD